MIYRAALIVIFTGIGLMIATVVLGSPEEMGQAASMPMRARYHCPP